MFSGSRVHRRRVVRRRMLSLSTFGEALERRIVLTAIAINDVTQYGNATGPTPFAFTVSLDQASAVPVSVDYATADGTATVASGDYQAQAGTLTFSPGQTSQTVTVQVNGEVQTHGNETFFVNLANPVNGTLAPSGSQGVGILLGGSAGTSYYVNGPSTAGDVYCTAPGNNANNGLSPATPVASIAALTAMYTFHPGDTIYIDTGVYDLYSNLVLGPEFSGVRIIGAGQRQVTPSVNGSAVLADGPVAFWRLGDAGGTTAVDATGNGYNGTYVGNITADPNAPTNDGAASFNSQGSYVTVPYSPALAPSQFTVEAWIDFQGSPGAHGGAVVNVGNCYLYYNNGSIAFGQGPGSQASALLSPGVWTFVAATLNSDDTIQLYVNGVAVGSPQPAGSIETGLPMEIGSSFFTSWPTWTGDIGDVALYNKVLTPAQLQAQYAQEVYTGTVLNRGNLADGSDGIELAGAVDVNISDISITGGADGIYADAGTNSVDLTVTDADLYGNGKGIDLEASNDGAIIAGSTIEGSNGTGSWAAGIYIPANNATISGDTIAGNIRYGVDVEGLDETISGNAVDDNGTGGIQGGIYGDDYLISDNVVDGNGGAAAAGGQTAFAISVVAVEATITGDQVYGNSGYGIYACNTGSDLGTVLVTGNTVYNNVGSDDSGGGILVEDEVEVSNNVVYGNYNGILDINDLAPELIIANRVFGNTNIGISVTGGTTVVDNDVYSNAIGIQGTDLSFPDPSNAGAPGPPFQGTIINNLVYGNSTTGIVIADGDGAQVINNTVYQPQGDGVWITSTTSLTESALPVLRTSQDVSLLNNIIWTQTGYDIKVDDNCQQGFSSDYNLLYTTELGYIGYWQTAFTTLRDWQLATGLDAQSVTGDPMFVNPAGPDGILGYDAATGVDGGLDDDFHLQSGSPAVAAGDPTSDDSAQPAPTGGRINLGAYGDTPQATTATGGGVILIQPTGTTQVVNGGAGSSYSIVLSSQPASDVTITLTPASPLTLSTLSLTFTPSDWDVAQSIAVKAAFNPAQTGVVTATINHAASSADPNYDDIAVPGLAVQIVPQSLMPTPTPTPTTPTTAPTTPTTAPTTPTTAPAPTAAQPLAPQAAFSGKKLESVDLSVQFGSASSGSPPPSGSATFEIITKAKGHKARPKVKVLGTTTLVDGRASLSFKANQVLKKTIEVVYGGDATHQTTTVTLPVVTNQSLKHSSGTSVALSYRDRVRTPFAYGPTSRG